jgi:hypothetical protein
MWYAVMMAGGCDCNDPGIGQQPRLQVEPKVVIFPVIGVGNKESRVVTLSNQGTAVLQIQKLSLNPKGDSDYKLIDPPVTPLELAPTKKVEVTVEFHPTTAGRPQSELWIDSDDPKEARVIVPLRTVGNAPRIAVEPKLVNFGFVDEGKTETREVKISNIGDADLNLKKIWIASASKDFAIKGGDKWQPQSLASKQHTTLSLSYSPSDTGGDIGELWIESDDPDQAQVRVLLEGRRSEPDLSVSPAILDFGGVPINKSRHLSLILGNRGGANLIISNLAKSKTTSDEFSVILPPLPIQIEPGKSSALAVFYSPKDKGTDWGQLIIESNDPDTPVFNVQLVGQSPPAGIDVNPMLLDFGSIPRSTTKTLALYIVNKGSVHIDLTAFNISSPTNAFQLATPPSLPVTLQPNDFLVLRVSFAPQSDSAHKGKLEIASTDQIRPSVEVDLVGNVIPTPPCFLQATPTLLNFQAVGIGQSSELSADVTNIGSGTCWLFQAGLDPATDLDFVLTSGDITMPISLGSGRTYRVKVAYSPRNAGPAQGTLQVIYGAGLVQRSAPLQILLTAIGAGPRICINPSLVDFGGVKISASQNEQFNLRSCGTVPVTISKISIDSGTSSEYSIPTPPALPQTLAVGSDINVTAKYAPIDPGADMGKIEIQSNSGGSPKIYAHLRGYALSPGESCGALAGRICAPDGVTWLSGATVSVKTPDGRTIQADTDTDGYFYLPCVPPGSHSFNVKKGAYSTDFTATVVESATTTLSSPQCVDPSRTKIAVVWGEWDQIQHILDRLKLIYTLYTKDGARSTEKLLKNLQEMKKYDIIFLNCGIDDSMITASVASNLRQFVEGGGSVYASDFSYDFVELAWPNAITWLGNDASIGSARQATGAKVQAKVISSLLMQRLGGRNQVEIHYRMCPCAAAEKAESGTNVILSGDRMNQGNPDMPLALHFKPSAKSGNVIYTTFHNDEQISRTIDIILRFLIFEL